MALNKKPYKGCRDFFPRDMRERNFLFEKMKTAAETFAYEPYDGPLLEEVDLYKAKSGEELINDQIYNFTDRGGRNVAIRPEMTPTLARMVANIHKQEAKPLRWYSIPNLMRYEKPQRGRVREHWQFNVDIFGAPAVHGEVEILTLALFYMKSFGATKDMFQILINDRAIVDCVFNDLLKLSDDEAYKMYKLIDNAKKMSEEKLNEAIAEKLADEESRSLMHEYLSLSTFEGLTFFLNKFELTEKCENVLEFIDQIRDTELFEYLKFDPTIVRGLDYYTGIVFEIFDLHPDNRRAIAGGGAYANLLGIFNESPLSGIGFGLGDVTMKDFLETHGLMPDLKKPNHDFILFYTDEANSVQASRLASDLRSLGLKTELNLGKIKFNKIFKLALSKNYNYIGIMEEKNGKLEVQVKNLSQDTSEIIDPSDSQKIQSFINKE